MTVCVQCKAEFEVDTSQRNWKNVKICSDECRKDIAAASKRRRYKQKIVKKKQCEHCEGIFLPAQTIGARQKYCSDECSAEARAAKSRAKWTVERRSKTCKQCDIEFLPKKFCAGTQLYCSHDCQLKAINERATKRYKRPKSYSREFDVVRPVVMERDGGSCVLCGESKKVHVHHLDNSGTTSNFNNAADNLVVLCTTCHRMIHSVTLAKVNGEWCVDGKIFDLIKIDGPIPINR